MTKEIRELFDSKDFAALERLLADADRDTLTEFFTGLTEEQISEVCRAVDSETVAGILVKLDDVPLKERIIDSLGDRDLKDIMDEMSVDDTVEIIEDVNADIGLRLAEEEEILRLLEERNFTVLKPLIGEFNPTDLAAILDEVPKEDVALIFRILPKDLAAETFVEMSGDSKEALIRSLNDLELKAVMDELFLDDTVDLIEEMPANVVKRIIAQSDAETRAYINEILKYPRDSAGSIMTIEFVSLTESMTVAEAFERVRRTGVDKETIYTMYVTDEKKKLIGTVSAKELLLASPTDKIRDIMEENVIYVVTHDDKEDVSNAIAKYGFLAMPVVDGEQRLVGIVTVDDAMQIMQEESTEDIAKMSAVTPSDKPYLKTGVFKIWLNRVPWLLLLMISATLTGIIISSNEQTLNLPVYGIILTACIPMLMDTGGNAGSQASVTIIRGIALGEVTFRDLGRVLWKEARVSLLLGLTLAIACFAKLMAIDMLWRVEGGLLVSAVVCLAMFITIVLAKLIGCTLPIIAKKCHLDPAVVASPFITTIVDALSLTIYCAVAVSLLGAL